MSEELKRALYRQAEKDEGIEGGDRWTHCMHGQTINCVGVSVVHADEIG